MIDNLISERMILARLLLGKNQLEVAQMIGFKGAAALSKMEKNQVKIRVEITDKIALALNCHPDWLLTGKINRNRHQYLVGSNQLSHFDLKDAAWKTTVTVKFIEAILNGEISPSDDYYRQLCAAFGIPPNETFADDLQKEMEKQKTTSRSSSFAGPPPPGYRIVPENEDVAELRTKLESCYEKYFEVRTENDALRREVERLKNQK